MILFPEVRSQVWGKVSKRSVLNKG